MTGVGGGWLVTDAEGCGVGDNRRVKDAEGLKWTTAGSDGKVKWSVKGDPRWPRGRE